MERPTDEPPPTQRENDPPIEERSISLQENHKRKGAREKKKRMRVYSLTEAQSYFRRGLASNTPRRGSRQQPVTARFFFGSLSLSLALSLQQVKVYRDRRSTGSDL